MAHVVDYEEFKELRELVFAMTKDMNFMKSQMIAQQWLTRRQALRALGCSDTKLMQLVRADKLVYKKEGKKPFYFTDSVRSYLTSQKIDPNMVDNRLLSAFTDVD